MDERQTTVNNSNQESLEKFIRDFFICWNEANSGSIENLLVHLELHERTIVEMAADVKDMVHEPENNISSSSEESKGEYTAIDLLKVNKILLKGMLTSPFEWDDKFSRLYDQALEVVEKILKNNNERQEKLRQEYASSEIRSRLYFLSLLYGMKDQTSNKEINKEFGKIDTKLKLWNKKIPRDYLELLSELNMQLPIGQEFQEKVISIIKCIMYINRSYTKYNGEWIKVNNQNFVEIHNILPHLMHMFRRLIDLNVCWLVMILSIFNPTECEKLLGNLDDHYVRSIIEKTSLNTVLGLFASEAHRVEVVRYLVNNNSFKEIVRGGEEFVDILGKFSLQESRKLLTPLEEHFRYESTKDKYYQYILGGVFAAIGVLLIVISSGFPVVFGALLIAAGVRIAYNGYNGDKRVKAGLKDFFQDGDKLKKDPKLPDSADSQSDDEYKETDPLRKTPEQSDKRPGSTSTFFTAPSSKPFIVDSNLTNSRSP